jgi:hypothetical protein
MKADLPQNIVSTLLLTVNGTEYNQDNIRPSQGFSDFYPQNSIVDFGFNSTEITTSTVNYKFTGWKDLSTGDIMSPANVTSDGLYEISLTRPYYLEATYEEWAVVSISTNLPPDVSTKLMFGMVGSANQSVTVPGSTKYEAGEFLVGSTFELDVPQNELVLYNAAGDTRYEFQGMSPITPITLTKHTIIALNYSVQYRVVAVSQFPSVIVQPTGGVAWYAPGQIATIRVGNSASDQYGIPYAFDGWSGAMTSNDTEISFPVSGPMEIEAQWKPNWTYILMMAGLAIGITVPSSLFVKRKLGQVIAKRRTVRKSPPKKQGALGKTQGDTEGDLKVYNYIIDRGGSISLKEAIRDLGMSREEINQSIERLKETHMLG